MERVTIAGDKPFGVDHPYGGQLVERPEIELTDADAPPDATAMPVRIFKRD